MGTAARKKERKKEHRFTRKCFFLFSPLDSPGRPDIEGMQVVRVERELLILPRDETKPEVAGRPNRHD
jgi:hypothetical protein